MRRNLIFILMSIEIMLNGAGLAFVVAGSRWGQPDGQIMFIFILALAAAEVSVGLALILQLYHHLTTLDADAAEQDERLTCSDFSGVVPAIPLAAASPSCSLDLPACSREALDRDRRRRLGRRLGDPALLLVAVAFLGARRAAPTRKSSGPGSLSAASARRSPSISMRSRWS